MLNTFLQAPQCEGNNTNKSILPSGQPEKATPVVKIVIPHSIHSMFLQSFCYKSNRYFPGLTFLQVLQRNDVFFFKYPFKNT